MFFSGVAKNRPYSLYLRLLLVASLLILGYDATALSTLADSGVARHGPHAPLEFDASFSGLTQSLKEGGFGGQSHEIDVK